MASIFSDLQAEQEKQKQQLTSPAEDVIYPAQEVEQEAERESAQEVAHEHETEVAHETAQKSEQPIQLPQSIPTADEVEILTFKTRRTKKVKVNTEVPESWKVQLDDVAHHLKVGKYELLAYIIGNFLDEV